jgi:ribonuclease D
LQAAPWVAIDTEADSLHAYPEKLCLFQIGLPSGNYLVDPLAGFDLGPMLRVLETRELILHGGDYDLRMLRKDLNFVPSSLFDTMLGARLLGIREFGLINLVHRFLGITLEKGPQKANWARRPLTPRMEEYALNDTAHLKPLSDLIRQQLQEKGRLDWHRELCQRLIADNSHVPPPDPDQVWRIKGSRHLPPRGLAVLREVWQWREAEAIAANRPPYFILSSELVIGVAIASLDPERSVEEMLPRHLTARRSRGVLEAVARGRKASPLPQVIRIRAVPPTEQSKRRFAELEKRRNARAEELQIDPTLIASKATLAALSQDWDEAAPDLMHWQRELLKD